MACRSIHPHHDAPAGTRRRDRTDPLPECGRCVGTPAMSGRPMRDPARRLRSPSGRRRPFLNNERRRRPCRCRRSSSSLAARSPGRRSVWPSSWTVTFFVRRPSSSRETSTTAPAAEPATRPQAAEACATAERRAARHRPAPSNRRHRRRSYRRSDDRERVHRQATCSDAVLRRHHPGHGAAVPDLFHERRQLAMRSSWRRGVAPDRSSSTHVSGPRVMPRSCIAGIAETRCGNP